MSNALMSNDGRMQAGQRFADRYVIEAQIGDGAQGTVYAARREPEGDRVALKVIHHHLCDNRQIFQRFHREAQILKQLEGEHVVQILDFIEKDGLLIIVLELVDGISLEAWLKERGRLSTDEAIEITLQVCAALGSAHAAGIVHRDLKPANVLIDRSSGGNSIRVKVVDFGVAKMVHGDPSAPSLTDHGMIFGTPEYIAPEQSQGDTMDGRSDLYAAGVMLYEMLVGRVPFQGKNSVATMMAHLTQPLVLPRAANPEAKISPSLEAVIVRALAKDPNERYPNARAFAQALAAARDAPLVIRPSSTPDDDESLAVSDTDLHLSHPSMSALSDAETVPGDAVAAKMEEQRRRELKLGMAKTLPLNPDGSSPIAPSQIIPISPQADPHMQRSKAPSAPSEPAPRKTGWIWLTLAVLAAVVGVVVGVIMGVR